MHMPGLSARRIASLTAVLGLAGSAAVIAAGPASADPRYNVDQWIQSSCNYSLCLWYHDAGQGNGGAGFGTNSTISNLDGYTYFLDGSPNNDGLGQKVRNNAGEISNGSSQCTDYAWYSNGNTGLANYVYPSWGGDLTAGLHNNEGSVEVACA
jgi:hypothetical protein